MNYFKTIALFLAFCSSVAVAQPSVSKLKVIPAPNHIKYTAGEFIFSSKTTIYIKNRQDKVLGFFTDYLKNQRNYSNKILQMVPKNLTGFKNAIIIESSNEGELPSEGYKLTVNKDRVVIRGRGAGLLYGINTFLQLLPAENAESYKIPGLEIVDQPRFGYRGLMLDVARHFYSVADVKKIIDLMAFYKLNTFHWHLVDNEGWRIQIEKYPKLTSIGGFRKDNFISFNRDLMDSTTYGGFYTHDEIRDVVKYAAERFITIVPEIEMPAHSLAALRAYPEFKINRPEKSSDPNSYYYLYNPTDETFSFLEDVLSEVVALFPGKYIHIGGDEANKIPWQENEFTQNLIRDKNLKDVHGLQSYFIQRIEKFLNSKGKSIIGWDEILEGGLAPNAAVMSWRGLEGGIASARQKHTVIMTPATNGMYLDYAQSSSPQEPVNIGGFTSLSKTYSYDPVPSMLTEEEKKYIIGVQANVWTEFIATPGKLQYMLFPRMLALSEIAWTNTTEKDYNNFKNNAVPANLYSLEKKGINFRVPEATEVGDTLLSGSRCTIKLFSPIPGSKIYYTINGRTPGDTDFEYKDSLTFFIPANEKRELQSVVVTSTGRRSVVTKTVMINKAPATAINVPNAEPGLSYKFSKGNFSSVDQLDTSVVVTKGIAPDLSLVKFKEKSNAFGVIYEGYVKVEDTGIYSFSLASDDGSKLYINDELVIDNDLSHAVTEKSGNIPLSSGFHKIKIKYFDAGGAYSMKVFMNLNNNPKTDLPVNALFHNPVTN